MIMSNLEKVTFGGGCFWCLEAVFQRVEGVENVVSGYAGGFLNNPTYKQVCAETTGHAEVIQVSFDPSQVSLKKILDVFWVCHDPTTLNRQGNDVGTQYRSIICAASDDQLTAAEESKKIAAARFPNPIVTEIIHLKEFFPAEGYHQNYYNLNSQQPYCAYVILPKLSKLNLH